MDLNLEIFRESYLFNTEVSRSDLTCISLIKVVSFTNINRRNMVLALEDR